MRNFGVLLLMALSSVAHAGDPLGRLFFTPAQRATLDTGKELEKPKGTTRAVRGPRVLTVNGIVTRSDGESTVWVNGSAVGSNRSAISASPANNTAARVAVPGTHTKLRVGQTLNRATGQVKEPYESATVPPGATKFKLPAEGEVPESSPSEKSESN